MRRPTFKTLWKRIESEAKAEGPEAVQQLQEFSAAFACARELLRARKARRLSQNDVSEMTGIPQSEISRIESGSANPTLATLQNLAAAYQLGVKLVPVASLHSGVQGDRKSTRRLRKRANRVELASLIDEPGTLARR